MIIHPNTQANPYLVPSVTTDGEERLTGIELEFLGLTIAQIADVIADAFKGETQLVHQHLSTVETSDYGSFRVELDCRLMQKLAQETIENKGLSKAIDAVLSPMVTQVAPFEIVTPPLDADGIEMLDACVKTLRLLGAQGTSAHPLHAFGMHINPEIAAKDAGYLLSVIQAYCLLHDELAADMDLTRKATSFAGAYPLAYTRLVLQPDYSPTLGELIDDYLHYNPTRDRGLDMLPCFMHLDAPRIRQAIDDPLVKPRPTFHFRLPNCKIDEANWSITDELNQWRKVEALAADKVALQTASQNFLETKAESWWFMQSSKESGSWLM